MPGIANKYFRIGGRALSVLDMTSAPVAAGYALGVFSDAAHDPAAAPGDEFTGLVVGDRVRDVSMLGTVNELLSDWDDAQRKLGELADAEGGWSPLAALSVHCPVAPGQIS